MDDINIHLERAIIRHETRLKGEESELGLLLQEYGVTVVMYFAQAPRDDYPELDDIRQKAAVHVANIQQIQKEMEAMQQLRQELSHDEAMRSKLQTLLSNIPTL